MLCQITSRVFSYNITIIDYRLLYNYLFITLYNVLHILACSRLPESLIFLGFQAPLWQLHYLLYFVLWILERAMMRTMISITFKQ